MRRPNKRQRKKNTKRMAKWTQWLEALRLMRDHCGFMADAMRRIKRSTEESGP